MSRRAIAVLLATAAACLAMPAALAAAAPDPAAEVYDPGRMYVIELTLPQASKDGLAASPNKYEPGKFSVAESDDGTPAGVGSFSAPVDVGIRLKGSASFRPLSGKSAFKIKFSDPGHFHGLKVITLNNMVEDPSMIHETLAYTAFRGTGVPASRTGYAYVYVNGEDFGVHLDIETLDQLALEKRYGSFGDPQHLYEGENGIDVEPGSAWGYEVDEGDEDDRDDLEALIEAVDSSGPQPWAARVAAVADLEEMTRMWAVEKYIGQWDGYAGAEDVWLPNNYYLYSDPSGRFQMLPWGNDESWQAPYHLAFDGRAGLMFDRCLDDEACAVIYRRSLAAVRKAIAGMNLDALAVHTATLLDPWQEMEQDASTREEWGLEEIRDEVAETRDFIASRQAEAAEWLGEDLDPDLDPPGSTPAPPGPGRVAGPPAPSLRVGRMWVVGGVLRTRMHLPARGVVSLRAMLATGKRSLVLCRDRLRVKRPRDTTLRCHLPASVREQLHQRSLEIKISTYFLPVLGPPASVTRRITLPRS